MKSSFTFTKSRLVSMKSRLVSMKSRIVLQNQNLLICFQKLNIVIKSAKKHIVIPMGHRKFSYFFHQLLRDAGLIIADHCAEAPADAVQNKDKAVQTDN